MEGGTPPAALRATQPGERHLLSRDAETLDGSPVLYSILN